MDFADEPYVRVYTRKTLTSRQLGWEGRAVLHAMLAGEEFDRAGIFAFRGDAARCVAIVTELPEDVVRIGLARIIDTETWIVGGDRIVWPTYEEAQNCSRSDRLRQRESRKARMSTIDAPARKKVGMPPAVTRDAAAVTDVTAGHSESQPVTASHSPSQNVTLPPSAPSHPPILPPCAPHERDRARTEAGPALSVVTGGRAGSSQRVTAMPSEDPPEEYLDQAVMGGVPREQAKSTWKHYFGAGLPERGVERLHHWLCQRAKERYEALAGERAGPRTGPLRESPTRRQADRVRMLREQEALEERANGGAR